MIIYRRPKEDRDPDAWFAPTAIAPLSLSIVTIIWAVLGGRLGPVVRQGFLLFFGIAG